MQVKTAVRSNAERSEAMRAALLAAARRLFVTNGYQHTSTPDVVQAADVTRGALYHHFADKADLFMAVALQAANEVAADIAAGVPAGAAPADALLAGATAYFAAMAREGRARLLLQDAPAVLSAQQLQQLNDAAGAAELRAGLRALLANGRRDQPLAELADVLSAAFDRAALAIANGAPPRKYKQAVQLLLRGLAAGSA